jgi:hypothetical protein
MECCAVVNTVFAIWVRDLQFDPPLYISIPLVVACATAWILLAIEFRRLNNSQGAVARVANQRAERESPSTIVPAELNSSSITPSSRFSREPLHPKVLN